MYNLLCSSQTLAGLSSEYCEGDKKAFRQNYGVTFKQAERALDALLKHLKENALGLQSL